MVVQNLCLIMALLLLAFSSTAASKGASTAASTAADPEDFWPRTTYNPDVPEIADVLGYGYGMKISSPREIIRYAEALAAYDPGRVKLVEYARSWQNRPLIYLVISSKDNMDRLAETQFNMMRLSDPVGLSSDSIENLVESTLPVSWLAYGVHGDEISSSDAALLTAYHLLAAKNSPEVDQILAATIVVIDPSQNPDGRARFVDHYRQTFGLEPAPHRLAAERVQPWPGGRHNHYLFDMNRDWFALTQPETKGRVKHYLKFQPVVYVDVHEMGSNGSYYFPPPAEPYNPHITKNQKNNLELYGKANAGAFDRFLFDYFTREIFDAYYPGYGDTWPTFQGAVGMTFEMASARGLAALRNDGKLLTYRMGVHRHFVSSVSTLLTTAKNRQSLMEGFVQHRLAATNDRNQYLFAAGDTSLQIKLAKLLVEQGIVVHQMTDDTRACGTSYPKGTIVVKSGQPSGRLVRTLLDAESKIENGYWEGQERRRREGLPVEVYDVLAWSVPALFNLGVEVCGNRIANLAPFEEPITVYKLTQSNLAYLVPWGQRSAIAFLSSALRHEITVRTADKGFTISGREYAPGTLVIMVKDNMQGLHAWLQNLSGQHGVEVVPLNSSWTTAGINFGSNAMKELVAPRIAIAWDYPTRSYSAGNTRFVIERQFGYPTTPIRTSYLAAPELVDFDVLILPNGHGYANVLGKSGMENIKAWVNQGGVLITLDHATRFLMQDGLGLLGTKLEARDEVIRDEEGSGLTDATFIDSMEEYNTLIHTTSNKPDQIPGVLLQGEVNRDHWLSGGVADTLNFMVIGNDVYTPLKRDAGINLVKFSAEEELVVGGYIWEENRGQLAHKPAVMTRKVGRGQVIAFTSDPAFRAYMDGLNVLLANAIFKAPAHAKGR